MPPVFVIWLCVLVILIIGLTRASGWIWPSNSENIQQYKGIRKDGAAKIHRDLYKSRTRAISAHLCSVVDRLNINNHQAERQDKERTKRERITIGALIFAGVAAFASDVILSVQLFDARSAAETQHKDTLIALTAVQRAFMVVSGITRETVKDPSGKIIAFRFSPVIRNSGNTPTKDLVWVSVDPFTYSQDRVGPGENSPADPLKLLDQLKPGTSAQRTVLGPHDQIPPATEFSIDDKGFQFILSGRLGRFYYGAIRYHDIFAGTEWHITKYCYNINNFYTDSDGIELKGPSMVARNIYPYATLCPHWNCSDDECKQDEERYADDKRRPPAFPFSPLSPERR